MMNHATLHTTGSPTGFSGSEILLSYNPGIGTVLGKRGARFGIVNMNGTRDLGILQGA